MNIPVFTHQFRKTIGRYALYLAIFSFIVHLILHLFRAYIPGGMEAALLRDPTSAIYTPFSILLVYEAYLMIYYLRRSTTIYIAKQYEVIALILIRGLFKDMAVLDLKVATWSSQHNLEFAADIILVVMAFYLVYWFYRLSGTYKYATLKRWKRRKLAQIETVCAGEALPLAPFVCGLYCPRSAKFISLGGSNFSEYRASECGRSKCHFLRRVLQLFNHFGCHYPAFIIAVFR